MRYSVKKKDKNIFGTIKLDGSKSISNRALIIQALCADAFTIHQLSTSNDTVTLSSLLHTDKNTLDAGAAGTTFRFMTAYLSLQKGTQVLTGSDRMKQRPIGKLVDALRTLGADIEYLEREGFPPLKIGAGNLKKTNKISISANVSSQFISALLLIAPTLPDGLQLQLEGNIVSRSYIQMTLNLMEYFGVKHQWKNNEIHILPQSYLAKDFTVEADWSAASYYYQMAAFADQLDLNLLGISLDSIQGDAALVKIFQALGIQTTTIKNGIHLSKQAVSTTNLKWDFINCPDIAQTLAVTCGGMEIEGNFTGLSTLKIKETDRLTALQNELKKVNIQLVQGADGNSCTIKKGAIKINTPIFDTYEDHRMAMSLAPLAILGNIQINDPMVVSKSYPKFYKDLEKIGFVVEKIHQP